MSKITPAQIRKIFVLCRERGLDENMLHGYIRTVTKKDSLKDLTIAEAIKVIDSLEGKATNATGMMTDKQKRFMDGLAFNLGWIDENGAADQDRLLSFIRERFKIESFNWIDSYKASKIIEALKAMKERMLKEKEVV